MDKMEGMSMDIARANAEKLRQVFPEAFADGKIDFDKLQGLLGHYIADNKEKYSFSWKGKADSLRLAQKRSTGTLRPCKEESKDWDTTQNLYIEGDNLEVLKLLQSSYLNSVKMIYIDPPYNTGNDFVYADDFADGIAHYKEVTGQVTKSNPETAGRYHTNWLNMMYPRLKLARNLLTDDGVIFISIDDNEQANLKKLCDEVFGEDNFINHFSWVVNITGRLISGKGAAKTWESVLVYARKIEECSCFNIGYKFAKTKMPDAYKGFNKDIRKDAFGNFAVGDTLYNHNRMFNEETRRNLVFSIFYNPDTQEFFTGEIGDYKEGYIEIKPHSNGDGTHKYHAWRWSKEKIKNESYNLIALPTNNGGYEIYTKIRQFDKTLLKDIITNISNGDTEVQKLFDGKKYFDYPKSVDLLRILLGAIQAQDSIILDFFSGSATTAHAVMQLNAEDGGHRKFICVQLPEKTDEQSEAYKAGYKTICEIGKERIRRAGEKIKKENKVREGIEKLDVGFKVFKLDSSNLVKWDNTPTTDEEEVKNRIRQLSMDYLVDGREDHDLVYEIMLKYGLPLTLPVEERKFDDVTAYIINHPDYKVLVCLAPNITLSAVEEMDKETIGTYIFADRCFADANILSNTEEILKKKDKEMRLF